MKIAIFHTTLPEAGRKPGGVEVAVHRLANALACDERDEVTVLSLTDAPADARYRHRRLFRGWPALKNSQALRLIVLPALLNSINLREYDVIHMHGDDWFWLFRGIPSVRTMHGSALFEARTAGSLKRKISQYLVYPLEKSAAKRATRSLAVGPQTAQVYGISDLANNGVDLSLFHPGEKSEHPQVLYVGTWEGRKRGRFLYDLFTQKISPLWPEFELVMVCDRQPRHERVRNVVFPDDAELAQLFRSAWVFAYPSIYEGFGIPYIEAMASGTAVLCSPNDGANYVLENGAYGDVVDDDRFADSLIELLTNHTLREQKIEKGFVRANMFSWSAVAAQHRAVYERVVGRRGLEDSDRIAVEELYER